MQVGTLTILGNAVQTSTGSFTVAKGTAAQRPTATAGMLRFNTDTNRFEATSGSTPAWLPVGLGDGSVSSVTLATASTGLSITNPTVTTSGTINITLAGELAGLNAMSATGVVVRTGAATYAQRSVAASTSAGLQGLAVANGNGVSGNPTVGLNVTSLTQTGIVNYADQIILWDGTNNTRANISALTTTLSGTFVQKSGDTMTGFLTLNGNPGSALHAAPKQYVDSAIVAGVASKTTAYRTSFTNATLSSGSLTVTHGLNQQFVQLIIYDNNNKQLQPDDITATSATVSTVDLSSFGTLTGTWNVVVIG